MTNCRFRIRKNVHYAIETTGVSIINTENKHGKYITYPEAAVWLVLAGNHSLTRSIRLVTFILQISKNETIKMMDQLMTDWRLESFIE